MDLTPEFTKCVRRARERQFGSANTPADRIIRKRAERSPVHSAADQIVRSLLALPCGSLLLALKYCDLQVAHLARLSESVATRRPAYLNFRGLGSHAGTNKLKSYCTAQAVLELLDLIPAGWVCHGCSNA